VLFRYWCLDWPRRLYTTPQATPVFSYCWSLKKAQLLLPLSLHPFTNCLKGLFQNFVRASVLVVASQVCSYQILHQSSNQVRASCYLLKSQGTVNDLRWRSVPKVLVTLHLTYSGTGHSRCSTSSSIVVDACSPCTCDISTITWEDK
jgi:hypothetical protein